MPFNLQMCWHDSNLFTQLFYSQIKIQLNIQHNTSGYSIKMTVYLYLKPLLLHKLLNKIKGAPKSNIGS